MLKPLYIAAALVLSITAISAASLLTEQQAHTKAVQILMGEPYGRSFSETSSRIQSGHLQKTYNPCNYRGPVWEFWVVVPKADISPPADSDIRGALAIDAKTGKMACATLPYLD